MTHLAVDLDDTVLDFTGGLCAVIQKEYGVELPEFEEWDFHHVLDPIVGGSWWKWMRRREWLWSTFPAIDGAIGSLDLLRSRGHYLELVTSKPEWGEASVWKWLGKWRPPFNRVTIVGQHDVKVAVTDAEVLIDDKIENCMEFTDVGRRAILFDRPHNRSVPMAKFTPIQRAEGWQKVLEMVS